MEVILIERIKKLGNIGDIVNVKKGYARNYLLPTGKALRANNANKKIFEAKKAEIEAKDKALKENALKISKQVEKLEICIMQNATESGKLYGSLNLKDIHSALSSKGVDVKLSDIAINIPIKTTGVFKINIETHPDVEAQFTVSIGKSLDEAQKILNKTKKEEKEQNITPDEKPAEVKKVAKIKEEDSKKTDDTNSDEKPAEAKKVAKTKEIKEEKEDSQEATPAPQNEPEESTEEK